MSNRTWDDESGKFIDTPEKLKNFFDEIDSVCQKYNLSISHEDCHGAFIITDYDEYNINWLKDAHKRYTEMEE